MQTSNHHIINFIREVNAESRRPIVTGIRKLKRVVIKNGYADYNYIFEARRNNEWIAYGPFVEGNWAIREGCKPYTLPESSSMYMAQDINTIFLGFYSLEDLYVDLGEDFDWETGIEVQS